jgi:hypothetical protein
MKWDQSESQRDVCDFSMGDSIVDLAAASAQVGRQSITTTSSSTYQLLIRLPMAI